MQWEAESADRLAEVHHVDARRRPWRAAVFAVGTSALALGVVPRPIAASSAVVVGVGAVLAGVAAWRLPLIRSDRTLPGGVTFELAVGDDEVRLTRDGLERSLAPRALEGLAVGPDHLFVHLAGGEVVTVPTRVFAQRGALDGFVLHIERFRRRGSAPEEVREEGYDTWWLRFRADGRRLAANLGRAGEAERRVLAAVAAVLVAVVLLASDPWGGGLDLVLAALFGGILVTLTAVSGSSARVATGDVHAGFGPLGGRISGPLGSIRFGWREVQQITERPDGLVIAFRDRVMPIPGSAFRSSEHQSKFVGAIEDWWQATRDPPRRSAPDRVVDADNPFAPPT
ncbi:MAG: hypothetical protein ABMA64_26055 [Myxococcota bacterium]